MVPPPPRRGAGARPAPPPQPPAPTGAAENKRPRANAPGRRTNRTQRSLVSTNRSGMGGHPPHGQHNASDTRFVACPGKAEGRNEAEQPPALQAPPRPRKRGVQRTPPPRPPQPTPRHTNATDPPRGAQPPQGVQAKGTEKGPHSRTPAPTTRGSRTPTAPPVGGQSGEGERLTPDAPRNSRRHPPRGRPTATPTTPSQVGGNRDRTAPHKHARRSKGPGADTRRCTDHVERPYQRPVPGPREVRTPYHPGEGGADAAGARAHTHAEGHAGTTRRATGPSARNAQTAWNGVPASERDTRTGRPSTHSTEHPGRGGGNERDTTPGTGPSPPNRPRAPRTHRRGTAPAKTVVAHSATPQFLG